MSEINASNENINDLEPVDILKDVQDLPVQNLPTRSTLLQKQALTVYNQLHLIYWAHLLIFLGFVGYYLVYFTMIWSFDFDSTFNEWFHWMVMIKMKYMMV